jgi:hypothetical protein
MTEMGRQDFAAAGSDIRGISDWVGQFSPFEGENLAPRMTRQGPPLTREQLDPNAQALPVTGKDALESGARGAYRSPDFSGLEEPDVKGTDYASYLEEIQALERTPEQIKGDAMTNALIELSGLAGAATRKETAEVLRKAGRSAQGIRETGNKELRENILARLQIDQAEETARLNKLRVEAAARKDEAAAKHYETQSSISTYLLDAKTALLKGPMAKTKGLKTLTELGIGYGGAGWENQFLTAYLLELGFSADEIGIALSEVRPGTAGGQQVITDIDDL